MKRRLHSHLHPRHAHVQLEEEEAHAAEQRGRAPCHLLQREPLAALTVDLEYVASPAHRPTISSSGIICALLL